MAPQDGFAGGSPQEPDEGVPVNGTGVPVDAIEGEAAQSLRPNVSPQSAEAAPDASKPDEAVAVDVTQVVAERDSYLADLQRVTAEFANFRRQTDRRNADIVARAASRLATDLLPVLDACEAAAKQGVEGINAVYSQLLGVLCGQGLSVLGVVGEAFDPNTHEAVLARESDEPDAANQPTVLEVLRTGYAWQGQVLRAAMVKVQN